MTITPAQQAIIHQAYQQGSSNVEIARLSGLSLSTIKRYNKQLGWRGQGNDNQLAHRACTAFAHKAKMHGLNVQQGNGKSHDLTIEGRRVDVRATPANDQGQFIFYLRQSRDPIRAEDFNYNTYCNRNADVVVFSCWDDLEQQFDFFTFAAEEVPRTLTVGNWDIHQEHRNDWTVFQKQTDV